MAEKETVLIIKADASQAEKDLNNVEKAVERVKDASEKIDGGRGKGGSGSQSVTPQRPADNGASAAQTAERDKAKSAGQEIGKFFVAYVLDKGAQAAFNLAKDPLTSNAKIDRAQSTFSGALMAGTAGATVGAKFGPWGAVTGAVVGGATGGLIGFLNGNKRMRDTTALARYSRNLEVSLFERGKGDETQDIAFGRILGMIGSRSKKIEAVKARLQQITHGTGKDSIENIDFEMAAMERRHETDSSYYLEAKAARTAQIARAGALSSALRELSWTPTYDAMHGADFADSLMQRGLSVGGRVDVGAVNTPVLSELRQIKQELTKIANAPDREPVTAPVLGI